MRMTRFPSKFGIDCTGAPGQSQMVKRNQSEWDAASYSLFAHVPYSGATALWLCGSGRGIGAGVCRRARVTTLGRLPRFAAGAGAAEHETLA